MKSSSVFYIRHALNSVLILEMKTRSTDPSWRRVRCACCSWCCESGRCHTSAITRLFHNTRVAPHRCRQRGAQAQMTHIDHWICPSVCLYTVMWKGHLEWWVKLFKIKLITKTKLVCCIFPYIKEQNLMTKSDWSCQSHS